MRVERRRDEKEGKMKAKRRKNEKGKKKEEGERI